MQSLQVLGDVPAFLHYIFSELHQRKLDVSNYVLDHICYRVATVALYEEKTQQLASLGQLLSETMISGRLIATYLLNEPINYEGRIISVVEIPQPKPDVPTKTGCEHVEFVINESFASFLQKYDRLGLDQSGLSKKHNPEIELKFEKANVKFHLLSLQDAIAREKAALVILPNRLNM